MAGSRGSGSGGNDPLQAGLFEAAIAPPPPGFEPTPRQKPAAPSVVPATSTTPPAPTPLVTPPLASSPAVPAPEVRPAPEKSKILSVTELSTRLKAELRDAFPDIAVQGEICDFKGAHRSGHLYFALKDEQSQIRTVMWRMDAVKVPFEIKNGLEVIVGGRMDIYAGSGSLQLIASRMEPVGIGALQLKFEQLKEKLRAEGLFDAARKRKISPVNWRIGLVTGKSTAALQDMLKIFRMRFPLAEVFLFHASVQGEKAPGEIIAAIERANRFSAGGPKPLDVLIIGRGGGSYEDLFCFNDEGLVRAIAASKVPTVSAVGHEIDVTIADMVADKRSATPSHAAQETVPELSLWLQRLEDLEGILGRRMTDKLENLRQRVDSVGARVVAAAPNRRLEMQRQRLGEMQNRLQNAMKYRVETQKQRLKGLAGVLDALSPLKVLDRGYSLLEGPSGIVKSVKDVSVGDELKAKLSDGVAGVRVVSLHS